MLSKILTIIRKLKITKLDRYIFKHFFLSLFGSLVLFVAIYQIVQVFNDMRWVPDGIDPKLLFDQYMYSVSYWIIILQPFSFLFASAYIFSRIANSKELLAIISTGTSVYRASIYIVVFTIVYYIFTVAYFQNEIVFPQYQKHLVLRKIIFERVDPEVLDKLKDNKEFSLFGKNNLLYIVSYYSALSKELENITIIKFRNIEDAPEEDRPTTKIEKALIRIAKNRNINFKENINIDLRIDAEKAMWDPMESEWVFYNGTVRRVIGDANRFEIESFEKTSFDFISEKPFYFEKIWYPVDAMTYKEGNEYIDKLRQSGKYYGEALARQYSKYVYSLGIIFIVLTGIGLTNLANRKSSFVFNLITSLFIFVIYYLFYAVGLALAGKGTITPIQGSFTGIVFIAVVSLFLYSRVRT